MSKDLARARESIERDHAELESIVAQIKRASEAQDFHRSKQLLLELQSLEEAHYEREDSLVQAAGHDMPAPHRTEHSQLIDTLRSINQTLVVENLVSISPRVSAHLEAMVRHMHKSDLDLWAMLA